MPAPGEQDPSDQNGCIGIMRKAEDVSVDMSTEDRLLACWAKLDTDSGPPGYHPLLWHMTDVAMVARELWQSVLSPAQRNMLCEALGLEGLPGRGRPVVRFSGGSPRSGEGVSRIPAAG